jgi:uncharacterized membrane protein YraQ (UPF0718 family)
MNVVLRYKWALVIVAIDVLIFMWDRSLGLEVVRRTNQSVLEMLAFVPPVFILLGLLDVWVPREKVIAHLGPDSGVTGMALAIFIGAAAAGPLYAAFPVAAVMMRKGAGFFNVMVFIGAWSTLKIPMFLFETQFLGFTFSVTRWICSFVGIVLIAFLTDKMVSEADKQQIYDKNREQ